MRKQSYRKPPKPATWNSPKGNCRFCGEEILRPDGQRNGRANWHKPCVHTWKIMNQPAYAREVVYLRDDGRCTDCGSRCQLKWYQPGEPFEVDHVRPLYEANGDLTYWMLENLRLLCRDCHKDKTRGDMEKFRLAA